MSYEAAARASHRRERESIVDAPQRPDLAPAEFTLNRALRSAILNAHLAGVSKARIAAVIDSTLRDHAFQGNVKP